MTRPVLYSGQSPLARRLIPYVVAGMALACQQSHGGLPTPGEQQFVFERYGVTDPGMKDLIKGLMSKQYPERLSSKEDIKWADPAATQLDIRDLPPTDYPLLKKFVHAHEVDFMSPHPVVTDRNLRDLNQLGLPELNCVVLNNCAEITDTGVQALSRIPTLTQLGLAGTSITDISCITLTRSMHATSINVTNCSGISFDGLKILASSATLEDISFTAKKLRAEEAFDLLNSLHVKRCEIHDLPMGMDAVALQKRGAQKNMQVVVMPAGT